MRMLIPAACAALLAGCALADLERAFDVRFDFNGQCAELPPVLDDPPPPGGIRLVLAPHWQVMKRSEDSCGIRYELADMRRPFQNTGATLTIDFRPADGTLESQARRRLDEFARRLPGIRTGPYIASDARVSFRWLVRKADGGWRYGRILAAHPKDRPDLVFVAAAEWPREAHELWVICDVDSMIESVTHGAR